MIIPQVPIEPPINSNAVVDAEAAAQIMSGDVRQAVKEIFLRHLVDGTVKKNDNAGVQTGISIVDLQTGRTIYGHEQDTEHYAASINKLPIVLLVLEDLRAGKLSLDQTMTWQDSDRRGGFGAYDQPGAPLQASLQDVIFDLLNKSGNTATRVLVNGALGGAEAVNERFAEKPQLQNTYLQPLGGGLFWLGYTTPRDSLWAMSEITRVQDANSLVMEEAMATNIFVDFGVRSQFKENQNLELTNKIGLLDDPEGNNRHDVGVIRNSQSGKAYGYAIFTTAPFSDNAATAQAEDSLQEMGRYMLHFSDSKYSYGRDVVDSLDIKSFEQDRMVY